MPLLPVCPISELPPGTRRIVPHGKIGFGVFNVAGTYHAYRNICPHAGAPVCEGPVSGTTLPSGVYEYTLGRAGCVLRCPWHGWEFDLATGEHLVDPSTRLKRLTVEITEPIGSTSPSEGPSSAASVCTGPHENLDKLPNEIAAGQICIRLPG